MPPRDRNLLSLVETQVSRYSHRVLYTFLNSELCVDRSLTYADLYERALVIAAALQQRGLQRSPVALLYPHGPDFIVAFLGAILAGAWPMPLTRPRGQDWSTLFHTLAVSGATTILALSTARKLIPESLLHASGAQLLCTDASELSGDVRSWQRPDVQPDDIAFIQYTSGSTSHPRGVVVTHANVLHNSERIRQSFGCSAEEICVTWLPFHHDMGLIGHVIQPLYAGMPNYFLAPVDFLSSPLRWPAAISRYRGTISGAPNFAYALCADRATHAREKKETTKLESLDLSTWRLAYCGSERIVPAVLQRFAHRFRDASFDEDAFFPCYGMAESTLYVCGSYGVSCSGDERYPGVGNVVEDNSIVIVDSEKCIPVPDGTTGEVWLKSASVSPGYFNEPDVTRDTFHQRLHDSPGYMRTGDLGYVSNGTLHIVGRLKNVIKRRGRSFHAEDIEARVESELSVRGVRRCAAFSIDGEEEEKLVLLLEHDGITSTSLMEAVSKDVMTLVCDAFGIVPDVVRTVPKRSLPLTTSGKLQRGVCRDRFLRSMQSVLHENESTHANREVLHESE